MRLFVSCLSLALVTALLIPTSASAQTDVECTAVHDWNGTRIGRWQGDSVHFEHEGRLVEILVSKLGFVGPARVHFTGVGCTGDAYMPEGGSQEFLSRPQVVGNEVWHIDSRDVAAPVVVVSHQDNDGICVNTANLSDGVPVYTFTLPSFTLPFHLEPEACFTPPDPGPEQIINGCVKNKNGALRVVADPADCTSRETPISWLGE